MAQNKVFSLGGIGSPCCCGGSVPTYPCGPCNIPKANLTLSWVNTLVIGNGSTTLTYSSVGPSWASGCVHGLKYSFACTSGTDELRVTFWTSGACPGPGQTSFCSNLLAAPFTLVLFSHTCSPFSMTYHIDALGVDCPVISSSGYTSFTVTYP